MFKPTTEQIVYFKKYNAMERFNKAFKKFTDNFFGKRPELTIMVVNLDKLFIEVEYAANELLKVFPEKKEYIRNSYSELIPYIEEAERKGIHLSIPDHLV